MSSPFDREFQYLELSRSVEDRILLRRAEHYREDCDALFQRSVFFQNEIKTTRSFIDHRENESSCNDGVFKNPEVKKVVLDKIERINIQLESVERKYKEQEREVDWLTKREKELLKEVEEKDALLIQNNSDKDLCDKYKRQIEQLRQELEEKANECLATKRLLTHDRTENDDILQRVKKGANDIAKDLQIESKLKDSFIHNRNMHDSSHMGELITQLSDRTATTKCLYKQAKETEKNNEHLDSLVQENLALIAERENLNRKYLLIKKAKKQLEKKQEEQNISTKFHKQENINLKSEIEKLNREKNKMGRELKEKSSLVDMNEMLTAKIIELSLTIEKLKQKLASDDTQGNLETQTTDEITVKKEDHSPELCAKIKEEIMMDDEQNELFIGDGNKLQDKAEKLDGDDSYKHKTNDTKDYTKFSNEFPEFSTVENVNVITSGLATGNSVNEVPKDDCCSKQVKKGEKENSCDNSLSDHSLRGNSMGKTNENDHTAALQTETSKFDNKFERISENAEDHLDLNSDHSLSAESNLSTISTFCDSELNSFTDDDLLSDIEDWEDDSIEETVTNESKDKDKKYILQRIPSSTPFCRDISSQYGSLYTLKPIIDY